MLHKDLHLFRDRTSQLFMWPDEPEREKFDGRNDRQGLAELPKQPMKTYVPPRMGFTSRSVSHGALHLA
jgi:hypothetical protein